MTPNLSQQAKGVMSPIDGPLCTSAGYGQSLGHHTEVPPKPDFFNVRDEEVFHC